MSSIALFELIQVVLIQDHPKDVEFLNCPIQHYLHMQNIFGSGVATGRFAMGSSEPLGEPQDHETIDWILKLPRLPHSMLSHLLLRRGRELHQLLGRGREGFQKKK